MSKIHARVVASAIAVLVASLGTSRIDALAEPVVSAQQNRSRTFGPGECGRTDPTYIALSNATGGQPFFFSPSEIELSAHAARETSQSDMLLWSHGTLDSTPAEFDVPIDSTIRKVTFSLSVDTRGGTLDIFDPEGRSVFTGADRVEDTTLNCGRIVTIDAPAAGTWRLRIAGKGRFWLVARGRTDLSIDRAEFVQAGGRSAHSGLFKIPALDPLVGGPAMLRVDLSLSPEELGTAFFDLVSLRGDPIQSLDMTNADDEFFGPLELPSEPFRLRVRGSDRAGLPFQRVFPRLFRAQIVEIVPARPVGDLTAGTTTALTFVVRNVGPTDRFQVTEVEKHRFISRLEPRDLTLKTGETQTLTVWLNVPADTPAGTSVSLGLMVTSQSAPDTRNSTFVELFVAGTP